MAAPEWLGSEGVWFVALNAVVFAIALLSRAGRPSLVSPRPGAGGVTVTRRASSALLQRLRSMSIFSYPSGCLSSFLQPDTATTSGDTEEEPPAVVATSSPMININSGLPSSRALVVVPPAAAAAAAEAEEEDGEEDGGDPNAMSMEEAYALVVAARQRPESEREHDARQSEVDAKAEEFIRQFKEDLRQQRLNSIVSYTQMLKQRALGRNRS